MKNISYLTDHYTYGIQRINSINAPINFIFFTDAHNRMFEYASNCRMPQIILPNSLNL